MLVFPLFWFVHVVFLYFLSISVLFGVLCTLELSAELVSWNSQVWQAHVICSLLLKVLILMPRHSRWCHLLHSSQVIDEPSVSSLHTGQFCSSAIIGVVMGLVLFLCVDYSILLNNLWNKFFIWLLRWFITIIGAFLSSFSTFKLKILKYKNVVMVERSW